jgi:hypothetical protein
MQHLTPLDQQRVISDFLRERVLKRILYLRKRRLFVNELCRMEMGQHPVQFHLLRVCNLLEETERELFTKYRQGL